MFSVVLILAIPSGTIMAEQSPSEETTASDGATVKVHYTLTVDGQKIDTSVERGPLEFAIGSGQVIPGFEKTVKGMKVGDKKSVTIGPADGYGPVNPDAIRDVPREQLPQEIKPVAGMMLSASGEGRRPVPVRIVEVKEEVIVMDFNHPLAGKTLNFDVEMMEIQSPPSPAP